jgi:membrane protein YqaA with SNARE-associated domain
MVDTYDWGYVLDGNTAWLIVLLVLQQASELGAAGTYWVQKALPERYYHEQQSKTPNGGRNKC